MIKKHISAIIFWGALWGLEEATIGHLLHVTALNIGWLLWFPLAYFFMGMVYKQTGKLSSILSASVIAASLKFVNLFMTTNLVIVICPALSILLEGISLFAVLKLFAWKKQVHGGKLAEVVSVSLLWRILFMIGLLAIPTWIMPSYPFKGAAALLEFLLYQGLVNSLSIYVIIRLAKKTTEMNEGKNTYFKQLTGKVIKSRALEGISFKPLVSLGILAAAIIIQRVL